MTSSPKSKIGLLVDDGEPYSVIGFTNLMLLSEQLNIDA